MLHQWAARMIPPSTLVMSLLCFEGVGAFVAPAALSTRQPVLKEELHRATPPYRSGSIARVLRRSTAALRMASDGEGEDSLMVASNAEEAAAKAAKLRAFAAELRIQVTSFVSHMHRTNKSRKS